MPKSKNTYKYTGVHTQVNTKANYKPAPSTVSHKVTRPKRNWALYDQQLKERGQVLRFVRTFIRRNEWQVRTGKPGRPSYSREAITVCYMLMNVLNLTTRGVEGYLSETFELLGWESKLVPDATTLTKRAKDVLFTAPVCTQLSNTRLMDGTGFAFAMRGYYASKKYGEPLRRRKFATAVFSTDALTGLVTAMEVTPDTGKGNGEISQVPTLLAQESSDVKVLLGDGAYDKLSVYTACEEKGIELIAPPRVDAKYGLHQNRDTRITQIKRLGKKEWKIRIGYHTRSLAESTNSAIKSSLGEKTRARSFTSAKAHITAKVLVYNLWRLAELG